MEKGSDAIVRSGILAWGGLACLLLAVLVAGCSDGSPATIPVRGRVLYQGKPVDRGLVTLQPTQLAEGVPMRPAMGEIQTDGTFQLSTFAAGDGVQPGEYEVSIRAVEREPEPEDDFEPVWLIPQKYGVPKMNELSVSIPADAAGPVEIEFELTD